MTKFSIHYDNEVVHTMSGERTPDPEWYYSSCRKSHYWEDLSNGGKKVHNAHYQKVGETHYDDGDGYYDQIDDFAWVCDYCAEELKPVYHHSAPKPIVIRGRARYSIDDEEVSEIEYTRRMAEERVKATKPSPEPKKKCTAPWGNYPNCCNEHSDRWYNSPA